MNKFRRKIKLRKYRKRKQQNKDRAVKEKVPKIRNVSQRNQREEK